MTRDSRAEMLIVAGFGLFLAFLWFRNKQNGAGNGMTIDLASPAVSNGASNAGVPLGLTMPDGFVQGQTYTPGAVPSMVYSLAQPGGCGCTGTTAGNTYGGPDALAAALLGQGYDFPPVTQSQVY